MTWCIRQKPITLLCSLFLPALASFAHAAPSSVLLQNDFSSSDLSGWSVVDQGTHAGPSTWAVIDQVLVQGSNIRQHSGYRHWISQLGTFLKYDAGASWSDYELDVTWSSGDDDSIGVMFRVVDGHNYYRFSMDRQRSRRRLTKFVDGQTEVLAEDRVAFEIGRDYAVHIVATGPAIEIHVDGQRIFEVFDDTFSAGTVALYCSNNFDSAFDDVLVRDASTPGPGGLTTVDDATWDETAVRKVMHAFAYGGQASDVQIRAWADMQPTEAVEQMLTPRLHNLRLSRPAPSDIDGLRERDTRLRALTDFWSSSDAANGVRESARSRYAVGHYAGPGETWLKSAVSRGANPFRQKLGLWETNYHMAVNQRASISTYQLFSYFDDIMDAHGAQMPYQDVVATAALSAAVTKQYKHHKNRYIDDVCECNEDFAREIHQLFFGILGAEDPTYHEEITIKNTAAALTDLQFRNPEAPHPTWGTVVEFGIDYHAPSPLEILNELVVGVDAAEKITEVAEIAIAHPESLENLPIMIVSGLADDQLSDEAKAVLRAQWEAMESKNLLQFLRAYAVSTLFHSPERVKFLSSIDRQTLQFNLLTLRNETHDLDVYGPQRARLASEDVRIFEPKHNVFGGQTGLEAAASSDVFRQNFNTFTAGFWKLGRVSSTIDGYEWTKDWRDALPPFDGDAYRVADVAAWLWQRAIADGHKNYGPLERAHLHALLAKGVDFGVLAYPDDPQRVITSAMLQSDASLMATVHEYGGYAVKLDHPDEKVRASANLRMSQAMSFIFATPFIFAQEGR